MLRFATLLLIVPWLVGCHPNYTIVEHSDLKLRVGDEPSIVVEMYNGPISISTANCKDITGQLTKRGVGEDKEAAEKEIAAIDFDHNVVDGKIIIKAKRVDGSKAWNGSGTEATLQVPSGSKIELITSNGSIEINGKNQGAKVKTSNGGINLNNVQAPVDVSTTNGAVRCTDVRGSAKIETTNGSIDLKGKQLSLNCKSSNGSITCTGDLASGSHQVVTSNSHINVYLPQDVNVNIDASTSNGRISNEFSLNKNEQAGKKKKDNVLKGTIGAGDANSTLVLKTSNSSIALKKAKPAKTTVVVDTE